MNHLQHTTYKPTSITKIHHPSLSASNPSTAAFIVGSSYSVPRSSNKTQTNYNQPLHIYDKKLHYKNKPYNKNHHTRPQEHHLPIHSNSIRYSNENGFYKNPRISASHSHASPSTIQFIPISVHNRMPVFEEFGDFSS